MSWRCPYSECDGSGIVVDEVARTSRSCRCRPELLARSKARRLAAVIPKRYRDVALERHPVTQMPVEQVRAVRHYLDDLEAQLAAGRGLWFMGDVGTGKTTLAMLVSKTALERGRSVAIYSMPRLLAELRKTYEDGSQFSYTELIDGLAAVDLLHLDDLGAERRNDWVLEQLYAVINARYEAQAAVVVTTNLEVEHLREQIGDRIVSRLQEMCEQVPMYGHDVRRDSDIRYPVAAPRAARLPEPDDEPPRFGEPAVRWDRTAN